MNFPGPVRKAFRLQAAACDRLGSPFTAYLCRVLPQVLNPRSPIGRMVAEWPHDPVESALALRLCGALHRLVRAGKAPALAALYPPEAQTGPALANALAATLSADDGDLPAMLDSAPQTNEVARSAILIGGMLTVAAETGLPLALMEIGSSAGLNLHADRYAYDFGGGRCWGAADATVRIACDWRGAAPPLDAPLKVKARAGVDLMPVDPADPAARERMLGYIWPDQPERLTRAAAALAIAAAHPAAIAQADAAEWVEEMLARPAPAATARLLMHSITWQYFSGASQARITAAVEQAGATANAASPLAWLRLEPDRPSKSAAILLNLWPGGGARRLGRGCYHGRYAEWEHA